MDPRVKPGGDACGRQRTQRRLARWYGRESTGPRPMLKAPMLLAAVLVVCVASNADARRRHHGYYGGYGERSPSSFDDWRRARAAQDPQQGRAQDPQQARDQDPQQQDRGQDAGQARGEDRAQDRDSGQDRARDSYDRRRARYDD